MKRTLSLALLLVALICGSLPLVAAQLQVLLPLGRTAYQTNELIDLAVVRSDTQALPAATMTVTLTGEDASTLTFTFPVAAVALQGEQARTTDHLKVNGWLLRPGRYGVDVTAHGATAHADLEVYSHIRKTTFKLIDWGSRAKGVEQTAIGEDGVGFNLLYGAGGTDEAIRGGMDYMGCCVMSGGHQMDLRLECDWSDPYVIGGAKQRVSREALRFRTNPNAVGVHFYDEPGLTWIGGSPHTVPAQHRAFRSAFGIASPQAQEMNPDDPASVALWKQWATWKLGFMDASWKLAQSGVSYVRPDFISATQSQYGWTAFTDGYYFNVARSLPVTSGHGGYDDIGPGYFCPSLFLEMSRARDLAKPCWYLPTWYGNTKADAYRAEQYLSFITGIQGMAKPPDMQVQNPAGTLAAEAIVETNKVMGRLGTIFTTMPPTRTPVAILYSLSDQLQRQVKSRAEYNYTDSTALTYVYLATKLIQQPAQAVVDEDILDGTLQACHKAVLLPGVSYLEPRVKARLEDFAAKGGLVLLTCGSTVDIKGAVTIPVLPRLPEQDKVDELTKAKDWPALGPYTTTGKQLQAARPLAAALKAQLAKAGFAPVFGCDNDGIVAARHAAGDIEYLFAVNATYDGTNNERNALAPTTATLTLPNDGRPIYDAVRGGVAGDFAAAAGQTVSASLRFGAGEMRAFARTVRPIAGVTVTTPTLNCDLTAAQAPRQVAFSASLKDAQGNLLSGSAPLRIRVVDPLGATRFDLYRATANGVCAVTLPLAANDPAGTWTITVQELLANTAGQATFTLAPMTDGGAVAGATPRAVLFGNDRENIYRFFRTHKNITIVKGTSAYITDAASRLAEVLYPWGVRCTIVNAADVNKPIELSPEEAQSWVGIDYAGSGQIKTGTGNSPMLVGYAVPGPVVLLGTPEDNALINALKGHKVLPYTPSANYPGAGRGMLAWQVDIIGRDIESIAAIAYDEAGMREAIGTLYELAAGLNALTPLALPETAAVTPATKSTAAPEATVAWQTMLADRAVTLAVEGNAAVAVTADGSTWTISAAGEATAGKAVEGVALKPEPAPALPDALKKSVVTGKVVKKLAAGANLTAVGYWGGLLQTFTADGTLKTSQQLPQDITGLAWLDDKLIVSLSDGSVLAVQPK